jgi:hypothetical protein
VISYHSAAISAFSFFFVLEKLHAPAATWTFDFKFLVRAPISTLLSGAFVHFFNPKIFSLDYSDLCANHRKQHFESLAGIDRMGHIGRHYDYLAM